MSKKALCFDKKYFVSLLEARCMYKDIQYRRMDRNNEYLVGAYCAVYNSLVDIDVDDKKYIENVWVFSTNDILHRMNMECKLGDRDEIETDESLYQIIPYITFTYIGEKIPGTSILKYTRGSKGGEDRLKTKHSIGFGGHIEELPVDKGSYYLFQVICDAALREANEETGIPISDSLKEYIKDSLANNSHFIVEDSPVGQVHLGIHLNINLDAVLHHLENKLSKALECSCCRTTDTSSQESDYTNMRDFIRSLLKVSKNRNTSIDVEEDIVKDIYLCPVNGSILYDYNWEGWSREVIAKIFV